MNNITIELFTIEDKNKTKRLSLVVEFDDENQALLFNSKLVDLIIEHRAITSALEDKTDA